MEKISTAERPDWQATVEAQGFDFHTFDGERYWDERAYYRFSEAQISRDLEAPTEAVHSLCLELVDRVVESEALLHRLAIPAAYHDLIRSSWRGGDRHLYGRFDFSYSGHGPAKLIEANYDTPTSLLEAGAVQLLWLEQQIERGVLPADASQFNTLAADLVQAFACLAPDRPFHFAAMAESREDQGTTAFLGRMAAHAGHDARQIAVQDIGLAADGRFVDLAGEPIQRLFKLHPWEHIFLEAFGPAVAGSGTQFFEPPWKAILSNKGMLPLLWELNPGHPNLLPAHVDAEPGKPVPPGWVRKPYFSREGANIELCGTHGERLVEEGPYTDSPTILQALAPLPRFGDSYTLIGAWVVGDRAAGIGIREDDSLITKDSSRFVPHVVIG